MNILQVFVLSVVEGVTEFLPISSTGHLILTSTLLNIQNTNFVKSFEIIIQLGAILAVLVLYWKKLFTDKDTFTRVAIAFIPTAIVGFVLYKYIKDVLLGNPWVVIWSLGLGGVLLMVLEKFHKEKQKHMSMRDAFIIGIAQSLSIVPGVSRAAATIVGAMVLGIKREAAVEFSFLLAIPTMAAATGLDLVSSRFTADQFGILSIGFIGAFATALVTVKWFIGFVKTHTFLPFAVYRIFTALAFYLFILR